MDILRLYPCLFNFLFVFSFAVVSGHLDLVLLLFGVVLDMLPQAAGVSVSFLTSKHLTTVWLLQNIVMKEPLFLNDLFETYRVLVCLFMLGSVRGVRECLAALVFAQEGFLSGVAAVVDF